MKWEHALKDYCLYLRIERGLSENSINNYRLDVTKLIRYIEKN
ncbi:site-specific integrase, partial [Oceanihabitans sediminis]